MAAKKRVLFIDIPVGVLIKDEDGYFFAMTMTDPPSDYDIVKHLHECMI